MPRRRANPPHDAIGGDRPCHRCGYSLRGLPRGGACPECGTPIHRDRGLGRFTDTLADAPTTYLTRLAAGLMVLAGAGAGCAVAFLYVRGPWRYYGSAWALVLALAWCAAVYVVTRPRPMGEATVVDPVLESRVMRRAVRWSQAAWVIAAAGWVVAAFAPLVAGGPAPVPGAAPGAPMVVPGEAQGRRIGMVFELIGFFTLVPLAVSLSGLADWSGDTGLADRLRLSAWVIAVGGAAGLLGGAAAAIDHPAASIAVIAGWFGWGGAMVAGVLFLASLAQLAYLAWWAIRNSADAAAVEARLAQRRAEHEAEIAARTQAAAEAARRSTGPSAIGPQARPPAGRSFDGHEVPRPRGGAEPYALEPEEP